MAYKKIMCSLLIITLLFLPVSANHQMSFSSDKTYYVQGQGNIVLTLQDTDNDGAMIGWDGVAVYNANNIEVANFDDNTVGQGHPIQAGQNLVWTWNQKYDVRAGKQNANNNGQLVPLGTYYGLAKTDKLNQPGNSKNYQTQNIVIDSDNNNNGVADSLDDDDNDGTKNIFDKCPKQVGSTSAEGCPDSDGDGFPDYYDRNGDGVPDEKVTDACRYAKEDKNGFHDDDGCPDEGNRAYKKVRAGAGSAALIGLIGAATFIAAPFTLGASLAFIGAEVAGSAMVAGWAAFENDPPDINYKNIYQINKELPQAFNEMSVTDSATATAKEFAEKSYLISEGLKALVKTMERHDGALQTKDYAVANKQAAAAREYSKYLKEQYLDLNIIIEKFARATDKYPKSKFLTNKFIELQNKVRKEGLPREEIDFARKIGFTNADISFLSDNFVNFDANKAPDMHISRYLRAWKPFITKYHAGILDFMSNTFGANLYISPGPSDVQFRNSITNFGVYYENAPNDAKTFSFVVTYDKKLKFVDCKIISGSCNAKIIWENKLLISGSTIEPIKYGNHRHLLDLKFKKSLWSWFDRSNRYILEVSNADGDTKGWLGSPNFDNLCEFDPKNDMLCDA